MSIFLVFLLCGIPGAFLTFVGVGHLWNFLRLRQQAPVPIRQIQSPSGAIELEGTARPHETTARSPFTDTRTLIHEWNVVEYNPSQEGSNWTQLASGDERHAFRLEDGTGTALIDVGGSSSYFQTTETIEVEGDESPPPAVAQFLQSTDQVDRDHRFPRRYLESRLDPGTPVYVYGPVRDGSPNEDSHGSIDAIVGVDNPDRGLTIGEDALEFADVVELFTGNTEQFIVTNAGEQEAERKMRNIGLLCSSVGLLFLSLFVVILLP